MLDGHALGIRGKGEVTPPVVERPHDLHIPRTIECLLREHGHLSPIGARASGCLWSARLGPDDQDSGGVREPNVHLGHQPVTGFVCCVVRHPALTAVRRPYLRYTRDAAYSYG